jgi:hypothetical protein
MPDPVTAPSGIAILIHKIILFLALRRIDDNSVILGTNRHLVDLRPIILDLNTSHPSVSSSAPHLAKSRNERTVPALWLSSPETPWERPLITQKHKVSPVSSIRYKRPLISWWAKFSGEGGDSQNGTVAFCHYQFNIRYIMRTMSLIYNGFPILPRNT